MVVNITLGGRSELGKQRKDICCAEEQFFKQFIQFQPKCVNCTKGSKHMSLKAGTGTFRHNQCNILFIYLISLKHLQINVAQHHRMGAKGKIQCNKIYLQLINNSNIKMMPSYPIFNTKYKICGISSI